MTRLKWNITELLFQALALFALFIPGMYYHEKWDLINWGVSQLSYRSAFAFIDANANHAGGAFGNVIIALMCINAAIVLVEIFNTEKNISAVLSCGLPVVTTALFLIFTAIVGTRDSYGYQETINWLFYVELLLFAGIIFASAFKNSKRIEQGK